MSTYRVSKTKGRAIITVNVIADSHGDAYKQADELIITTLGITGPWDRETIKKTTFAVNTTAEQIDKFHTVFNKGKQQAD